MKETCMVQKQIVEIDSEDTKIRLKIVKGWLRWMEQQNREKTQKRKLISILRESLRIEK